MATFGVFFSKGMLLLAGIVVCGNLQAEKDKQQSSIKYLETLSSNASEIPNGYLYLYGGMSLIASSINSNFQMNYALNRVDFPQGRPYVNHKEDNLRKFDVGVVAGIQKDLSKNFFLAVEGTFTHGTTRHQRDFTQAEDAEIDYTDDSKQKISHIDIEHKDEFGLLLKAGPRVTPYEFYGIFGVSTKQVKIGYELNQNHDAITSAFSKYSQDRVLGTIIGFGLAREITKQVSCALDYKYKMYNRAKVSLSVDDSSFNSETEMPHDASARNLEVDSRKHELSLSIAVRTAI